MPKTKRILSYLPGTFRLFPKAPVLYAVVDAFGRELLSAENTLAEVMSSHWVDHADRNAEVVNDLERLAALYGLAPRRDEEGEILEGVEEFREHLKRYVRTFLEGTVTVQGILRVTAEALGLQIADDYADLDSWWNHPSSEVSAPRFVTRAMVIDEAAQVVFGFTAAQAVGTPATSAEVIGDIDLSRGIDLRQQNLLRVKIDDQAPVEIDFANHPRIPRPRAAVLQEIVDAIRDRITPSVVSDDGKHLVLRSLTMGTTSQIAFEPPQSTDALDTLFGLAPGIYRGQETPAAPARLVGTQDLSNGADLRFARFLEIAVEGTPPIVVDCAVGAVDLERVELDQIVANLNSAISPAIATHDGTVLTITSNATGIIAQLEVQTFNDVERDARNLLFGNVPITTRGTAAKAANIISNVDLVSPVNLSQRQMLRLSINGSLTEINIAGNTPEKTSLAEIITKINSAVSNLASTAENGRLQLSAPASETSSLAILPLRYLELIEYPPVKLSQQISVHHGNGWTITNDGVTDTVAEIQLTTSQGTVGITLVNETVGWQVRILTVLAIAETVKLSQDPEFGLQAMITSATGEVRAVPGSQILVGLVQGTQAQIPFAGSKYLSDGILQLNSPTAANLVVLRARSRDAPIAVTVTEHITSDPSGAIAPRFDVVLRQESESDTPVIEQYIGVSIGNSINSLVQQINSGSTRSNLVRAEELPKNTVLSLPCGNSHWRYLECYGSRFNQARFDHNRFAGGFCAERGVFNVSHFSSASDAVPSELRLGRIAAVFTTATALPDPSVDLTFNWVSHRAGAFVVNLPSDLPPRFGGKFNEARFSQVKDQPERFSKAVTEPATDPHALVSLINQGLPDATPPILPSNLLQAQQVSQLPMGWQAVKLPFRKPQFLKAGTQDTPAKLYLSEEGFEEFIELRASQGGTWGNDIAVSARPAGAALYDVSIFYHSSRFENARAVVRGGETLPDLAEDLLKPGAIGVLQAKAAGIQATVTRNGCGDECFTQLDY
ncbi:hypothetical protein [Myxacorys almedinensis]|uniref:Uncharacterized protein n=1 Tax=Myxacorys almedinensis A TaxID=2690445 RepID=A0A8J8CKW2_9CYAN|nr:hypothetical protein [Myxacorys almedinensis]NDJ19011.1 hypothetical protein [Myxacorys almedinensis A]